jgi:hypothetical protein
MPWNVLPDLNSGTYVVATHMDQLRENVEWLGALRVGATTLGNLSAAYILGGAGFSAYDTSNQSFGTSLTKVTFTLERFDTNGAYDTSNSRFTAPVAGLYLVGAHIYNTSASRLLLVKNGTTVHQYGAAGLGWQEGRFTTVLSLAASDYLELQIDSTAGGQTITKSSTQSEFWGVKVG